ncbi:MAG: hypothetical protein MJE68_11505 [Proteobacteria bacterium]|nr:hypothetical protein [Pseudomonadota bacterium]
MASKTKSAGGDSGLRKIKKEDKSNKKTTTESSTKPTTSEADGRKNRTSDRSIRKLCDFLGQKISAAGERIRSGAPGTDRTLAEGDSKKTGRVGRAVRAAWVCSALWLLSQGICFVFTKPHKLMHAALRRLIPSISTGQLNFLIFVLLVLFAWGIRRDVADMLSKTIEIQTETGRKIDALCDRLENQIGTLVENFQDAITKLEGVAGATLKSVQIVAEKASGAVKYAYYSIKNWLWSTNSTVVM